MRSNVPLPGIECCSRVSSLSVTTTQAKCAVKCGIIIATRAMNYGVRCSDVLFHLLSEWLRGVFFPVPLCGQARVVVDSLRTFVVVADVSGNSVLLSKASASFFLAKRQPVSWAGYKRWLRLP